MSLLAYNHNPMEEILIKILELAEDKAFDGTSIPDEIQQAITKIAEKHKLEI